MSARYGFGSLPPHVLAALMEGLDQGPWQSVRTTRFEHDDEKPAKLLEAPRFVQWKLQLRWPLGRLVASLAKGVTLDAFDRPWDRAQQRLDGRIALAELDDDAEVVAAAGRVRKALLKGNGTAQTRLPYEQEVSFGRTQVRVAKHAPLADDVARLGLGDALDEVRKTTDALAKALGVPEGAKRAPSPSERVRAAMVECAQALNDVMSSMDWHLAHLPEGDDRAQVAALRNTLALLLDQATNDNGAADDAADDAAEPTGTG